MTTTTKIKIRRGPIADLDQIQLDDGEMGVTTDTKELYIGIGGVNNPVSVPKGGIIPVDWNNKYNALSCFKRIAGTGTIGYDATESMVGVGCFTITGNGTWVVEPPVSTYNSFAISSYFGLGGRIAVKGVATFEVGCTFYNGSGVYLAPTVAAQNSFVINGVGTSTFTMHENYVKNEGIVANTMPVGSKLAKPYITISNSLGTVKFDYFNIYHLESLAFYS